MAAKPFNREIARLSWQAEQDLRRPIRIGVPGAPKLEPEGVDVFRAVAMLARRRAECRSPVAAIAHRSRGHSAMEDRGGSDRR